MRKNRKKDFHFVKFALDPLIAHAMEVSGSYFTLYILQSVSLKIINPFSKRR